MRYVLVTIILLFGFSGTIHATEEMIDPEELNTVFTELVRAEFGNDVRVITGMESTFTDRTIKATYHFGEPPLEPDNVSLLMVEISANPIIYDVWLNGNSVLCVRYDTVHSLVANRLVREVLQKHLTGKVLLVFQPI